MVLVLFTPYVRCFIFQQEVICPISGVINDLSRVSWQNVECFDDPNLVWQVWKSDFNTILDQHAPIRHILARQSSVPWLKFDIKKMMKERDYHKKHAIKYGSHNHWIL